MNWKKKILCAGIAGICVFGSMDISQAYMAPVRYQIGDQVNTDRLRTEKGDKGHVSFIGKPTALLAYSMMGDLRVPAYFASLQKQYGEEMDFYLLANAGDTYLQQKVKPVLGNVAILTGKPLMYSRVGEEIELIDKNGRLRYHISPQLDHAVIAAKIKEVIQNPAVVDYREQQAQLDALLKAQRKAEQEFHFTDMDFPTDTTAIPMLFAVITALSGSQQGGPLTKTDPFRYPQSLQDARDAKVHMRLRENDEAFACLGRAIARENDNAELYAMRGGLYSDLRQWEAASQDLSKAISLAPGNHRYRIMDMKIADALGLYAREAGDLQQAYSAKEYKRLGLSGVSTMLYIKGNQTDKGLALYKEQMGTSAVGDVEYGALNAYAGRYAAALSSYAAAQRKYEAYVGQNASRRERLDRYGAVVYKLKAVSEYKLKQYDAALADINQAIAMKPKATDYYGIRAIINEKAGHTGIVQADMEKAFPVKEKAKTPKPPAQHM